LVFLQRPTVVGMLFGPGTGHTHLDEEIPSDGIGMDMASVVFYVHLPKCACKGCQSFLYHDTLSAIQLPLPSKELPLQLNVHRVRRRQGPMPINK
jgi:hypothetical protein